MAYEMKYTKSAVKKTGTPFPFKESPTKDFGATALALGISAALGATQQSFSAAQKKKQLKKTTAEARAKENISGSGEGISEEFDPQTGKTNLLAE